jgi:hypothetical protein
LEDEDDAAEKAYSGRTRVFPGKLAYLIYKLPFVGLCKLQVQLNHGFWYFAQKKKGTEEKYIKEEKERLLILQGKKVTPKKILESIKGCKHPLIASGATTIRSARRAPDEIITKISSYSILEPILEKLSTIASGATPIGSTGRAPNDNGQRW